MNFKVSAKCAIGILSLLIGYADAARTHPADALLKRDDGIAASGPADFPLRMSRKNLMDFPRRLASIRRSRTLVHRSSVASPWTLRGSTR